MSEPTLLQLVEGVVEELEHDSHSASVVIRRSDTARKLCEVPRDALPVVFQHYQDRGDPSPNSLEEHVQLGLVLLMVRLVGALNVLNLGVDINNRKAVIKWVASVCAAAALGK